MPNIDDIIKNNPVPIPDEAKCFDRGLNRREFYYTENQVRQTAMQYAKAILETYIAGLPVKPTVPFYRENEIPIGSTAIPIHIQNEGAPRIWLNGEPTWGDHMSKLPVLSKEEALANAIAKVNEYYDEAAARIKINADEKIPHTLIGVVPNKHGVVSEHLLIKKVDKDSF
jgi:hypothetical protein